LSVINDVHNDFEILPSSCDLGLPFDWAQG
jgi:hypothetical protein